MVSQSTRAATSSSESSVKPVVEGPGDVYYRNCGAARAAGAAPLVFGMPGYRSDLDRDGDGIACE
jgi:hypothetical protein